MITSLFLLLSVPSTALAFSDVPDSHPFAPAITYVQEQGIVKGYADDTFKPDASINRAEFTKIIVEAAVKKGTLPALPETATDAPTAEFSDADPAAWYAPYIAHAKTHGVIKGYDDGTFKPANPVNMAEAAKILTQALKVAPASDAPSEPWYEAHMAALRLAGAIPSSQPLPEKHLSRGEMADAIHRLLAPIGRWSTIEDDDLDFTVFAPAESFTATATGNSLRLTHAHPLTYDDPCDLSGEIPAKLRSFVDADFTFTLRRKNLADTVRELEDAFLVDQFLKNDKLTMLDGFIEPVEIAGRTGTRIIGTAEGCGTVTYYFSLSPDATLRVDRKLIAELTAVSEEFRREFLSLPGVIEPKTEERIFIDILRSFTLKQASAEPAAAE